MEKYYSAKIDTSQTSTGDCCGIEGHWIVEADVEPETPAFFTEKKPRRRGQRKAHGWQDY